MSRHALYYNPVNGSIDSPGANGNVLQDMLGMAASNVFHVGGESWMYSNIQSAVDAINAGTAPSASDRALIHIWPGKYTMTGSITIPAWTGVRGASRGTVQLENDTTDMFLPSGNNWFEDLIVEGGSTSDIYAFKCNNASAIHVRRVDMLNNGGTSRQSFLHQYGATWTVLTMEDCVIDYFNTSSYAVFIGDSGTTARFVDCWVQDCFVDSFQLTGYGGGFQVFGCQDVRFWRNTIRGTGAFHTGVRVEIGNIVSGTPTVEFAHCNMSDALGVTGGAIAIYNEPGTHFVLDNSLALGAITGGTSTRRNSTIA